MGQPVVVLSQISECFLGPRARSVNGPRSGRQLLVYGEPRIMSTRNARPLLPDPSGGYETCEYKVARRLAEYSAVCTVNNSLEAQARGACPENIAGAWDAEIQYESRLCPAQTLVDHKWQFRLGISRRMGVQR